MNDICDKFALARGDMQNKLFLFLLFMGLCFSANAQKNLIDKVFTQEEAKMIYKIIDFYDAFVLSKTDTNLPIDKAYLTFIGTNASLAEEMGDLGLLIPDDEYRIPFFYSLNRECLKAIFVDSVRFRDREQGYFCKYIPDYFEPDIYGKYMLFIKKMSNKKKFYRQFYKNAVLTGTINNPVAYCLLLYNYQNINFEIKDERLIFVVMFLFHNFIDN